MDLSIVILTCNQRELTRRCLASLEPLLSDGCELIVVDNGSTDGSCRMIAEQFPSVRTVRHAVNIGVAAGRNSGLRAARGRYLMILDNDTVATPEAVRGLLDYLQSHPDTGLAAPMLRSPQGQIQQSYKQFPGLGVKIRNVLLAKSRTSYVAEPPSEPVEPFYVIGAAQMFSAEVYTAVGGLDERIFYGPEDADFCMRVRQLGLKVVYLPGLCIMHDWQRSTTRRPWSKASRRHIRALLYFYLKHRRFW